MSTREHRRSPPRLELLDMLHHGCHRITGEVRSPFPLPVDPVEEEVGQEVPRSTLEEPPP
jgi:hypothetical protein